MHGSKTIFLRQQYYKTNSIYYNKNMYEYYEKELTNNSENN